MREIKYRKDSDTEVYKCVIYVSIGSYRPVAKVISAELGLIVFVFSPVLVLVCNGDQQQEAGASSSNKYERLKLCRSASNVPTSQSTK